MIIFPDGATYRRWGECNGCLRDGVRGADCCRYVVIPDRPLIADEVNWLTLHGLTIEAPRNIRIDVDCSALTEDGLCSLVGSPEHPEMCTNYPELPGFDPACSYRFDKVA